MRQIVQHETMIQGIASTVQRAFHDVVPPDRSNNSFAISPDGKVNLDCSVFGVDYGKSHPVRKNRLFHREGSLDLERLWVALLVEDYDHLVEWSMDSERSTLAAEKNKSPYELLYSLVTTLLCACFSLRLLVIGRLA